MKIILDFDYTLFSAKKFVKTLRQEFEKLGVNEKLFWLTFREAKGKIGYKPEKQFKLINDQNKKVKVTELKNKFQEVLRRGREFLYPDVLPFLEEIKKNNELVLVSYGEREFQKKKIENSKISDYFTRIIISGNENKITDLKKVIEKSEKVKIIEDNPFALAKIKENFPNVTTIRINRKEGKYSKQSDNKNIDFSIKALK